MLKVVVTESNPAPNQTSATLREIAVTNLQTVVQVESGDYAEDVGYHIEAGYRLHVTISNRFQIEQIVSHPFATSEGTPTPLYMVWVSRKRRASRRKAA